MTSINNETKLNNESESKDLKKFYFHNLLREFQQLKEIEEKYGKKLAKEADDMIGHMGHLVYELCYKSHINFEIYDLDKGIYFDRAKCLYDTVSEIKNKYGEEFFSDLISTDKMHYWLEKAICDGMTHEDGYVHHLLGGQFRTIVTYLKGLFGNEEIEKTLLAERSVLEAKQKILNYIKSLDDPKLFAEVAEGKTIKDALLQVMEPIFKRIVNSDTFMKLNSVIHGYEEYHDGFLNFAKYFCEYEEIKNKLLSKDFETTAYNKWVGVLSKGDLKTAECLLSFLKDYIGDKEVSRVLSLGDFNPQTDEEQNKHDNNIKFATCGFYSILNKEESRYGNNNTKDALEFLKFSKKVLGEKDIINKFSPESFYDDKNANITFLCSLYDRYSGHYDSEYLDEYAPKGLISGLEIFKELHIDFSAVNEIFELMSGRDFRDFLNKDFVYYLANENPEVKITSDHVKLVEDNPYLNLYSIQKALEDGVSIDDKENFYKYLKKYNDNWQASEIYEPFEKGIEYFGAESMFKYIDDNKKSTEFKNKIKNFGEICKICDSLTSSKDEREKFFHNILEQVTIDSNRYFEGDAFSLLNAISMELNEASIVGTLNIINKFKDMFPNMRERLEKIDNREKILSSWKSLKEFMEFKKQIVNMVNSFENGHQGLIYNEDTPIYSEREVSQRVWEAVDDALDDAY